MFSIVMCLEQCNSQVQLKHYAAKKKIKQKISPNPIENLSQRLTQWTKHHTAVTIPTLEWLLERDSDESTQLYCDVRDQTLHCQNQSNECRFSWLYESRDSRKNGEKLLEKLDLVRRTF